MLDCIHRQNGYGAHKRREHCEVCYIDEGRVGTWRAVYDDGTVRFFCNIHVTAAFAEPSPAPAEPLSTP
jgi:hypothetical protein